uniref:C-type lectin domain-containing protein n=1 Tax=Astyanax mexicanus TaxID=7994 RepID=A0A3B1J4S4_ASTMX
PSVSAVMLLGNAASAAVLKEAESDFTCVGGGILEKILKSDWLSICLLRMGVYCFSENKPNNERYVFINDQKTWCDAQSYCRKHHTDLASVRSQAESQLIINATINNNHLWIGLFNDSWEWSDQSSSSFRYWNSNQPNNNKGNQDYCTTVKMTEQGHWNDKSCDKSFQFVCHESEKNLI